MRSDGPRRSTAHREAAPTRRRPACDGAQIWGGGTGSGCGITGSSGGHGSGTRAGPGIGSGTGSGVGSGIGGGVGSGMEGGVGKGPGIGCVVITGPYPAPGAVHARDRGESRTDDVDQEATVQEKKDEQGRKPGVPPHQPQPDDAAPDERVDEGAEESFPSSDPPATGGPGI